MKIVSKETIANDSGIKISKIEILSPEICLKAKAGQFVVLIVNAEGERIPLTIVDTNREKGTITLIFQEIGLSTKLLGTLSEGDSLYALAGPLGEPTHVGNLGKIILIGGGVGIAEIYPVAKAFKSAGSNVAVVVGSRTKKLLILEKELRSVCDEFYVATDDGSCGKKGFVTDILNDLLNADKSSYNLVYAVGPVPMMKRIAEITKIAKIKTVVSLNALMVDATGMCGCCRVSVAGEIKFSCVDGPEFDAHSIDWDELVKRSRIYSDKESHICNLINLL